MGPTPSDQSRPGIMIVNPRLHDPSPANAALFLRWTRLHFRDLLDMDVSGAGGCESVGRAMRFSTLDGGLDGGKYGHVSGTESTYFYTLHTPTISTFTSPAYYALPRRLDIENTRALQPGEDKVGCNEGTMVWDVVNAGFGIYEEVTGAGGPGVESYQSLTSPVADAETKSCLVGVGLNCVDEAAARDACASVIAHLRRQFDGLYASLYRSAGETAQPDQHPVIGGDVVGGCEWVVLVRVDDDGGGRAGVEGVVGEWVAGREGEVRFGVWSGEVDMQR